MDLDAYRLRSQSAQKHDRSLQNVDKIPQWPHNARRYTYHIRTTTFLNDTLADIRGNNTPNIQSFQGALRTAHSGTKYSATSGQRRDDMLPQYAAPQLQLTPTTRAIIINTMSNHIRLICNTTYITILCGCGHVSPNVDNEVDGGDEAVDARLCFGTNPVTICLEGMPTSPLTISSPTMLNTENSPMCARVKDGAPYCVLAGTAISIAAPLRATGIQPLVLVASESISISAYGMIDVGSHRDATPEAGAGADPTTCAAGTPPTSAGGGGAGGSFTGRGGNGASGGGVSGIVATATNELRGGCPGQAGEGSAGGLRGHGGGVVHLIAGSTITVSGIINAAGEGGGGGGAGADCSSTGSIDNGGAGGGAGGMIGFDAPNVTGSNLVLANGGGGGGGGGCSGTTLIAGSPGQDPSSITAARGGIGGSSGLGGNGSSAAVAGAGAAGNYGSYGSGGGGGGAGLVKAPPTANLGTQVSPPSTP